MWAGFQATATLTSESRALFGVLGGGLQNAGLAVPLLRSLPRLTHAHSSRLAGWPTVMAHPCAPAWL
jgi:hypothetical protein